MAQQRNERSKTDDPRGVQNPQMHIRQSGDERYNLNRGFAANDSRFEGGAEERKNSDTSRKIENVQISLKNTSSEGSYDDSLRVAGVQEDFETEKSVAARAYKKPRSGKRGEGDEEDGEEEESLNERRIVLESLQRSEVVRERIRQRALREASVVKVGGKIKKVSGLMRWGGLGMVGFLYFFQLVFAVLSLLGFGAQATVKHLQENTWYGKVIGWIVDVEKYFPGKEFGLAFWGLGALLTIVLFIGFLMWYQMIGVKPFGTILSFFITVVCFALNILPVSNLFPWFVVWVLYMNIKDFSTNFG